MEKILSGMVSNEKSNELGHNLKPTQDMTKIPCSNVNRGYSGKRPVLCTKS